MSESLKPSGSWTKYLVTGFISCLTYVVRIDFIESWLYVSLQYDIVNFTEYGCNLYPL